jgi:sodium-coupled neutral amino acid transporter 7/8
MVSEIFALLPGLLNFPKAFDEAGGILVGIVVQASLIVFIVAALLILGKY